MIKNLTNDFSANRIPLVLWSGGLDSTFILLRELYEHDVDVLEVTVSHMDKNHNEAEAIQRDRICDFLNDMRERGLVKGKIRSRLQVDFSYPLYKGHDFIYNFDQQPLWLLAAYANSHPRLHDTVLIGTVLGDHLSPTAPEMLKAWDALREMTRYLSQKRRWGREEPIELDFPLLHTGMDKNQIWHGMNLPNDAYAVWIDLRHRTFTCSAPKVDIEPMRLARTYGPCKQCRSCKTRAQFDDHYKG